MNSSEWGLQSLNIVFNWFVPSVESQSQFSSLILSLANNRPHVSLIVQLPNYKPHLLNVKRSHALSSDIFHIALNSRDCLCQRCLRLWFGFHHFIVKKSAFHSFLCTISLIFRQLNVVAVPFFSFNDLWKTCSITIN